jgi:hypothetical protein
MEIREMGGALYREMDEDTGKWVGLSTGMTSFLQNIGTGDPLVLHT